MKNFKSVFIVALISIGLLFLGSVKAEDLGFDSDDFSQSNKLTFYDYLGGGLTTHNVTYDSAKEVTILDVTTTLNDENIKTILNEKPGNSNTELSHADIGTFYFGVKLNIEGSSFNKQSAYFYKDASDTSNVDVAKTKVDGLISGSSQDTSTYTDTYYPQFHVLYKNGGGFVPLTGDATGVQTIGDALLAKISGKHSIDELVYGEDFVFYSFKELSYLQAIKSDTADKNQYLIINNKVEFPVEGENKNSQNYKIEHYFPDLETAIETNLSNVKTYNVNEPQTIDDDLEIPADITINANEDITVEEGKTLNVNGTLVLNEGAKITLANGAKIEEEGEGKIQNTNGDPLYVVNIEEPTNGSVTVDKSVAKEGDKVTITPSPASGYVLDTIVVIDGEEHNVTLENNSFTMPKGNVTVKVTYKLAPVSSGSSGSTTNNNDNNTNNENNNGNTDVNTTVPNSPQTSNYNLVLYVLAGVTSFGIVLLPVVKKFKRLLETLN